MFYFLFQALVGGGGYPCTYPGCGAILKFKTNFAPHMRKHLGIYQYYCPYCNKGLSATNDIKKHLRIHHTGLYGYHCNKCKKEFENVHRLKDHLAQKSCSG